MSSKIFEIPGLKEELAHIKRSNAEAFELIKNLLECSIPKGVGFQVFKDGKEITHRCKVTESAGTVTVDIGCDLDEAMMRLTDPMSMQTYYMLGRNKTTGRFDTIPIQIPKFMGEIMAKVLPGSFVDNKPSNP